MRRAPTIFLQTEAFLYTNYLEPELRLVIIITCIFSLVLSSDDEVVLTQINTKRIEEAKQHLQRER